MYNLFPRTKITLAVQPNRIATEEKCIRPIKRRSDPKCSVNRKTFCSIFRRDSTCRGDTRENLGEWTIESVCLTHRRTKNRLVQEYVGRGVGERIQPPLCLHGHRIFRNTPRRSDFPCPTDSIVAEQSHTYPLEGKTPLPRPMSLIVSLPMYCRPPRQRQICCDAFLIRTKVEPYLDYYSL